MANWKHFYLVRIEFLGYRYHGWQKQPGLKTVHLMIDKTLSFVLGHDNFRSLGCSRTDAKVSAEDFAFELFIMEKLDLAKIVRQLNQNLPNDIRAKDALEVNSEFNIIQSAKLKEYHYHFAFGEKPHPFLAPTIHYFSERLDLQLMREAAKIFQGKHNFKRYVSKPAADTMFEREIITSEIMSSSTQGIESYFYKVSAIGFMRYQVRLMMGALLEVGQRSFGLHELANTLVNTDEPPMMRIAPSSGLRLHKVTFE